MTPTGTAAAQQYRKLDTEGAIEDASPHRLIQLMMERVLTKIGIARAHIGREEKREKGRAIGDAIDLVNGLQASLNHDADSKLAESFDALYTYMMRRLLEANLRDDPAILDEVTGLMKELKEAWDAIAEEVAAAAEETGEQPVLQG